MANDVSVVRIPGVTVGGALQVSNTTIIALALAGIVLSVGAMHCLSYNKQGKNWNKERKRHSGRRIEKKVLDDVISYATDVTKVAHSLPAVRNLIHTMRPRINATIDAYNRGEMSKEQFDSTIRNLYPMVTQELGIPVNALPAGINNKFDNKIDKIADSILEGKLPAKIKFRMYKNHPGLAAMHEMGRKRALSMANTNYAQALHTSAGVYLRPQSHYGSWERQYQ